MAGKNTRDYEADLGPMGGQEELPLNEPERPVLRVSPGVAVSHEHLDKVPHGSLGVTPGVGPMEIWATFGILEKDGSLTGSFSKKRVGWDEARRLQELVREVGWSSEKADGRSRIEGIAALPNGDILSAAEAVAEIKPDGRATLVERCKDVVDGFDGDVSLLDAVGLASRVQNDDIRAPREVLENALWLLGSGSTEGAEDLLAWLLAFEEEEKGLTGLVGECDEFYRELTGQRPSSTHHSRVDRAAALRFRIAATDAIPDSPALGKATGSAPDEQVPVADEAEPVEEVSSVVEMPVIDAVDTVDLPGSVLTPDVEEDSQGWEVGYDDSVEELDDVPESTEAASGEMADFSMPSAGDASYETPLSASDGDDEDLWARVDALEGQLSKVRQDLKSASRFVIALTLLMGIVFSAFIFEKCSSSEPAATEGNPGVAPRVGDDFAGAGLAALGEDPADAAANGSEEEAAKPAEESDVPVKAEAPGAEKAEVPTPVEEDNAPAEAQEAEDEAPVVAQAAEPVPVEAEAEEARAEPDVDVPASGPEAVAEKYGIGFKPTHRFRRRSKLYRFSQKDFVEVVDLPGGDALVGECIVAKAPRHLYRRNVYQGFTPIYLSCAGEMKVICEELGCEPEKSCVTAGSWIKDCD